MEQLRSDIQTPHGALSFPDGAGIHCAAPWGSVRFASCFHGTMANIPAYGPQAIRHRVCMLSVFFAFFKLFCLSVNHAGEHGFGSFAYLVLWHR
jgi:hypothetical protein